jgi:hypothetical protein
MTVSHSDGSVFPRHGSITGGRKLRRIASFVCAAGLALAASGCSAGSIAASSLGPVGDGSSTDPGCIAALKAISTYGPKAVESLAHGREDVNKAVVNLLVIALDSAADVADQPAAKQAIRTLANVYEDYYDLTTDVVAVPTATLLKDTANLDTVCQ